MTNTLLAEIEQETKSVESEQASEPTPPEADGVIPGLTVEARDERMHVWITPDFVVLHGSETLRGAALSLEGFEIVNGRGRRQTKRPLDYSIRIDLGGYTLELPVKAAYEGQAERNGRPVTAYRFTDIEAREHDVLRRLIRAHLSGHVVTVDDIVRRQDAPTWGRNGGRNGGTNGRSHDDQSNVLTRSIRGLFNLTVTLAVIGAVVTIGGFAIYERLTIVQGRFATVTAPSVELLAPTGGRLVVSGPSAGSQVARDAEIVRVVSSEIEADLIIARSRVRAINNALERANLAALELRAARNTIYSPCDCIVLWAPEDGAWVLRGDRLYTLARTGAGDLKVEALVHLHDVDRLYRGQTAYVNWPETDAISEGTIEYIALDSERQPRVGFPNWLRQDQSLVSVMITLEEPIDPSLIGHPVDVFVRTELNFLNRVRQVLQTLGRDGAR